MLLTDVAIGTVFNGYRCIPVHCRLAWEAGSTPSRRPCRPGCPRPRPAPISTGSRSARPTPPSTWSAVRQPRDRRSAPARVGAAAKVCRLSEPDPDRLAGMITVPAHNLTPHLQDRRRLRLRGLRPLRQLVLCDGPPAAKVSSIHERSHATSRASSGSGARLAAMWSPGPVARAHNPPRLGSAGDVHRIQPGILMVGATGPFNASQLSTSMVPRAGSQQLATSDEDRVCRCCPTWLFEALVDQGPS